MLKAVLFDMDDTLLDWSKKTMEWHEHEQIHLQRVWDYVVRDVHPVSAEPQYFYDAVRSFARHSWTEASFGLQAPSYAEALRRGLEYVGVPGSLINLRACLEAYDWQLFSGVTVFPDVPEALSRLAERGLQIGLITNASVPMWLRDRELETCGILQYFGECRYSAVDVGVIKPHPTIFRRALNQLSIAPEEAVFVGDNLEADILGAQGVGMKAVLRIVDSRAKMIPGREIIPNGEIDTLDELLPLLDSWYPGWRPPNGKHPER